MRREPSVDLRPYFLTLADLSGGRSTGGAFFGNENRVELDVGCGTGPVPGERGDLRAANELPGDRARLQGRATGRPAAVETVAAQCPCAGGRRPRRTREVRSPRVGGCRSTFTFRIRGGSEKHKRRRLFTDEFVDLAAARTRIGRAAPFMDRRRGVFRRDPRADGPSCGLRRLLRRLPSNPPPTISTIRRASSVGGGNLVQRSTAACGKNIDQSRSASRRGDHAIPVGPSLPRADKMDFVAAK
jgi:hypothetical protein